MSARQDTTLVPSLQDQLSPSGPCRGLHEAPPCRQDPDAFDHVSDEMTERDADAAFVAEMERREAHAAELRKRWAPPAGWHESVCPCGQVLLVQDGVAGPVLCSECEEARAVAV